MNLFQQLISILAVLMLFLFGLQSLSHELQKLIEGNLRATFNLFTQNTLRSLFVGLATTVLIQSSSAVTALTIALVAARTLTLKNALAIIIGANIGTASTAFIVSFKLEFLGVYLIVLGSFLSFFNSKSRVLGKTIFYFGFILFVLDQLNNQLKMYFEPDFFRQLLASSKYSGFIPLGLGLILTVIFQSSSLVTGFIVSLGNQGFLDLTDAIFFILGANIGTTSTALIASIGFDRVSKQAALGNLLFNVISSLIIYPFVRPVAYIILSFTQQNTGLSIAISHLFFNVLLAFLVTPFLDIFEQLLKKMIQTPSE